MARLLLVVRVIWCCTIIHRIENSMLFTSSVAVGERLIVALMMWVWVEQQQASAELAKRRIATLPTQGVSRFFYLDSSACQYCHRLAHKQAADIAMPARRNGLRRQSIALSPQSTPGQGRRLSTISTTAVVAKAAVAALKTVGLFQPSPFQHTLSGFHDQGFEIFVLMPTEPHTRERLLVHRAMSLVALQATIQRELSVPFEDQQIFLFGDLLEGDDELGTYGIQSQTTITLKRHRKFRSISGVHKKIKTIRFRSRTQPDDFQIVEVVAPLPPIAVVFRRLVAAISYLLELDKLQAAKSHRRVWHHQPLAPRDDHATVSNKANETRISALALSPRGPKTLPSPRDRKFKSPELPSSLETASSFVLAHAKVERLSAQPSPLVEFYSVQQHLQHPPDSRPPSSVRQLRKWLATLAYFRDANIPDAILHEVARTAEYAAYKPGDFIFRQGDTGDVFYILITGCVALAAYGNGYFATMTPGRCFGDVSLLEARGVRSASANVTFATPLAELAVVPGDVYRRAINSYKQAVLQSNEQALCSIPVLRSLPLNVLTHLAYGVKIVSVRPGKRLIRSGDMINVLVLLIKGAVKVSSSSSRAAPSRRRSSVTNTRDPGTPHYRIVCVVNGPAVFGQEGALSNSPTPAPWDIEAIDTCSLVCLRPDMISIFLSPCHGIVRGLNAEHSARIKRFDDRFSSQSLLNQPARRTSKKKSSLHLLKPQATIETVTTSDRTVDRVAFPNVLLKDDDVENVNRASTAEADIAPTSPSGRPQSSTSPRRELGQRSTRPRPRSTPSSFLRSSKCATLQDQFLHQALPFANILSLRDQIQFGGFNTQSQATQRSPGQCSPATTEKQSAQFEQLRVDAMLRGLRRLPPQDGQLLPFPSSNQESWATNAPRFQFNPTLSTG